MAYGLDLSRQVSEKTGVPIAAVCVMEGMEHLPKIWAPHLFEKEHKAAVLTLMGKEGGITYLHQGEVLLTDATVLRRKRK